MLDNARAIAEALARENASVSDLVARLDGRASDHTGNVIVEMPMRRILARVVRHGLRERQRDPAGDLAAVLSGRRADHPALDGQAADVSNSVSNHPEIADG